MRVFFHGQNKYKARLSVQFSVRTKKLINIKVRKLQIGFFFSKYTKRTHIELWVALRDLTRDD